jgi:ribosomal-protein-alanine N-acetyltransferase
MQNTVLRRMMLDDLDKVMAIETQAYPFPWTEGNFRDCLTTGYACWVAELADDIIGYAVFSIAVGEMHILNICINPNNQGKGLGRWLLENIQEKGQKQNAQMCFLEVRQSNTTAQQLYLSNGSNEVGFRKNYYPAGDKREHAIVMAKNFFTDDLLFSE